MFKSKQKKKKKTQKLKEHLIKTRKIEKEKKNPSSEMKSREKSPLA